jgi:hypothetical protein
VTLQPGGYVGPVVRPSERSLSPWGGGGRGGGPPSGGPPPHVRALPAAFPGAVVEQISDDGTFAVAAVSEEQGRGIATRLQEWETAGRLTYRSVSRSGW